ncbi:MAG: HU family DNA-binding protein [Nitrospinota bacterium]
MNKAELVQAVAKDVKLSKGEAERAVNSILNQVTLALKRGDGVTLVGFGSFSVVRKAARKGRNPQTGAVIQIKATRVPRFRSGASLKAAVKR